MDESGSEGTKESGKGRGAERAMPIRHKASAGKKLKREEGRVRQVGRWRGWDKQVPEVGANRFGACEEGDLGRGRVEERTSDVSKEGVPVRANKGRDTEQGMKYG